MVMVMMVMADHRYKDQHHSLDDLWMDLLMKQAMDDLWMVQQLTTGATQRHLAQRHEEGACDGGRLLDTDGILPADRVPVAAGPAGSYETTMTTARRCSVLFYAIDLSPSC